MKSVLISIQPKWCELIASGKKTVEVRKTKPKLDTPFKVYIYCTYGQGLIENNDLCYPNMLLDQRVSKNAIWGNCCNGKVIGEFVCDWVKSTPLWRIKGETGFCAKRTDLEENLPKFACLSIEELKKYAGSENRLLYYWHISNLVIYDEPRELSEFVVEGDCLNGDCKKCKWFDGGNNYNVEADCLLPYDFHFEKTVKPLFRPPQSWCYVESEVDTE